MRWTWWGLLFTIVAGACGSDEQGATADSGAGTGGIPEGGSGATAGAGAIAGTAGSGATAGMGGTAGSGATSGAAGSAGSAGSAGASGAPSGCPTTPSPVPGATGTVLVVAVDGDDSAGDGSVQKPYRTLQKACGDAQPGDAIELRAGPWTTKETCKAQGTPQQPIHIRPYPGENVVFDADNLSLTSSQSVVEMQNAKYVVVDGLEVKNSRGRGIGYYESTGITLRNLKVHDVMYRALGGGGEDIVIENNEVWNASLSNENAAFGSGGWPGVIQTYARADGSASKNIMIRNNYVHEAWGECIIALFADGVTIEGNRLQNCYSVSLYVDNSRNVRVERNQIWVNTNKYDKNGGPASGITFASENYSSDVPKQAIENLFIVNNLITHTGMGISRWQDPANTAPHNTWKNVEVLHNVLRFVTKTSIRIPSVGSQPSPSGGVVANNVIWKGPSGDIDLEDTAAWQVGPNAWPDGTPSIDKHSASVNGDPGMLGATGADDPDSFRLGPSSPCRGKGEPLAQATLDFFCTARSTTAPSIGIHEP